MSPVTFRDPRVVYYGPHPCSNCGQIIVKANQDFGGISFNQPDDGPIYPNTTWHPHVCDPRDRIKHKMDKLKESSQSYSQPPQPATLIE